MKFLDSTGPVPYYNHNAYPIQAKNDDKNKMEVRFKRTPQRGKIYRAVSKKYRSLSVATVYNTLNTLAKAGALRELTSDPERKRYDPDTSRHHHLICVLCREIVDIPAGIAADLPGDMARDLTLLGNHIEFYGHCSPCKTKGKSL